MNDPVMSIERVCELLGCKRSMVFALLRRGILERAPRWGRSLRITTPSVLRALQPQPKRGRKPRARSVEFERINPDDVHI